MGTLYIVRHCEASGSWPDAPLTEEEIRQSEKVGELLSEAGIERIVSSPFTRARQSILPLSRHLGVKI